MVCIRAWASWLLRSFKNISTVLPSFNKINLWSGPRKPKPPSLLGYFISVSSHWWKLRPDRFCFYVQSIIYEASGSHFLNLLILILRINLAKIYNLSIVDTKLFVCKNCDNSWVLVGHIFIAILIMRPDL